MKKEMIFPSNIIEFRRNEKKKKKKKEKPVVGRSLEGWPEVFRHRKISGRRKM